ncbi:hypothetical protein [Lentzea waywayandensis]|uniref:hypothetical protein n=1 Tax=Lentzea waywayandensis TaxID=84724 RepID=UPI0015A61C23|nr:hypothetical protein [Lentzea waywayandensis]
MIGALRHIRYIDTEQFTQDSSVAAGATVPTTSIPPALASPVSLLWKNADHLRAGVAETKLYDEIGTGYSLGRRTDPRWMTEILAALGLRPRHHQRQGGHRSPGRTGSAGGMPRRHEKPEDRQVHDRRDDRGDRPRNILQTPDREPENPSMHRHSPTPDPDSIRPTSRRNRLLQTVPFS